MINPHDRCSWTIHEHRARVICNVNVCSFPSSFIEETLWLLFECADLDAEAVLAVAIQGSFQ